MGHIHRGTILPSVPLLRFTNYPMRVYCPTEWETTVDFLSDDSPQTLSRVPINSNDAGTFRMITVDLYQGQEITAMWCHTELASIMHRVYLRELDGDSWLAICGEIVYDDYPKIVQRMDELSKWRHCEKCDNIVTMLDLSL